MKSFSCRVESIEEFNNFCKLNNLIDSSQLFIQVFSGILDRVFINNLREVLKKNFPNAKVIGTTTDGEIFEGSVSTNKCVIMFTYFEATKIKTALVENKSLNSYELGENITKELISKNSKLLILFGAGLELDGEAILKGVSRVKNDIIVAGGVSADNSEFDKPLAFNENQMTIDGVVGASFESEVLNIFTGYSFDWKLIGKVMRVTKAKGNRLYTIDNEKTVDIYAKYLSQKMADNLPAVGSEFPLVITRGGIKVARAATQKHSDGSLTLAGSVEVGDEIQFAFGSPEMILSPTNNLYNSINDKYIESIFIYSCMGRRRFMPNIIEKEIKPLNDIAPNCGFFTYGEFYHHNLKNELLNQTMTIVGLSENFKKVDKVPKLIVETKKVSNYTTTVEALSFFVNATLGEMEKLNNELEDKVKERTSELENYKNQLEKRVKEETNKRREQEKILIEQSRLASMGEMIGNIAHQWRQPLNALSILMANIKSAYDFNRLDEAYIDKAMFKSEKLIKKMSTTIDDFRNFFKPDKEMKTFFIFEVVESIFSLLESSMKNSNIDINIDIDKNISISGYENEYSQVVINLINNAKDVLIEKKIKNPKISIFTKEDKECAILVVKDNGGGIKKEILNRIFEPYFTTKEQGKGTGIGLYMSKTIIEEHMDGKISIKNIDGGAEFHIKIKKYKGAI